MRLTLFALALSAGALLALPGPESSVAGWGSGGCGPSTGPVGPALFQAPAVPPAAPARGVNRHAPCSGQCSCGCQAGPDEPCECVGFKGLPKPRTDEIDPFAGGNRAPAGPKAGEVAENFGINLDKLHESRAEYSHNGRPVSREEAIGLVQGKKDSIPDDGGLARLTAVGPKADRLKVLADLAADPALAALKPRLLPQEYDPAEWPVAYAGLKPAAAGVTVFLQKPDGTLLYRGEGYAGPAALANDLQAALDGKPQPGPCPGPGPCPAPGGFPVPPWLVVAGGLGVALLLSKRKAA